MCSPQILVELAVEREQDIPALIYEGRSTAVRTQSPFRESSTHLPAHACMHAHVLPSMLSGACSSSYLTLVNLFLLFNMPLSV